MFFTKAGKILAWLSIIAGIGIMVLGAFTSAHFAENDQKEVLAHWFREFFQPGVYLIFSGVGLGVLSEISGAVRGNK